MDQVPIRIDWRDVFGMTSTEETAKQAERCKPRAQGHYAPKQKKVPRLAPSLRCMQPPRRARPAAAAKRLMGKNPRGIPNAIGPALHVIAKQCLSRANRLPMPGRLPPAMHALLGCIEQRLA